MLKKLDWYTLRTFFGPFFFIFSVLFFIFMVQFAWQEMERFAGKGLSIMDILKMLFYLGLSVIQLVMPLTVLLSAIMTFGGFGERYELAAMKSTGISLGRIMLPLFFFVFLISVGLFYFSDTVVPQSQKKAKNMLINIAQTKPALNFDVGVFIEGVPGFSMKIGDKHGQDGEFLEDVFIHKDGTNLENTQTIISKEGVIVPAQDKRYLKLALYDGFIYEDEIKNKKRTELEKQPNRIVKFDTLVQFFDISSIINKAVEDEKVTDHYKFMNTRELADRIDTLSIENSAAYHRIFTKNYTNLVFQNTKIEKLNPDKEYKLPFKEEKLDSVKKVAVINDMLREIKRDKNAYNQQKEEIKNRNKFFARHVILFNRNFSNALMCLAFFLIGAPLGAIIRKGGVGTPVVVAIVIFILFYIVYMYSENLAKNGVMNPYWASWLPIALFLPLGLFFTYQAMTDSDLFDVSTYKRPFEKLFAIFVKDKNTEHSRYQ